MKKTLLFVLLSVTILKSQNQITYEQFSACSLPSNWSLSIEKGNNGFAIAKSNLFPSYDATCSIIYNQSTPNNGGDKKFSISTNEFDLYAYDQYVLNFGLRLVNTNTSNRLTVYSEIDGIKQVIQTYTKDVIQNGLVVVNQTINLNATNSSKKIRFIFEYQTSGIDFNTLIIIDNLILTGPDNDDCARAVSIELDKNCLGGNSTGALMTGPAIQCSGNYVQSLWYKYQSSFNGKLKIETKASFNDAVSIFEGNCTNLKDLSCFNKDEYGFEGESNFVDVESGKSYFIRVAKQIGYYGREDVGDLCVSIKKQDPVFPPNDLCDLKRTITVNANCVTETNIAALFNAPIPSLNNKSRADIWYTFKTNTSKDLEIISHADFADVLTIFKGTCTQLTEVKCEDLGGKILLENPSINVDYFIQVSGYFSSIEGHFCLEVKDHTTVKPTNEDCLSAKAIVLNQACQTGSTINSAKSNVKPSCVVYSAPDVWYSFVAPAEKNVSLDIQAGFIYNYGIYSGTCSNLTEVACGKTPNPCEGPIVINGLEAGKTYFLQIMAAVNPLKPIEGDICVRIDELSKTLPFSPIDLNLQINCLHGVLGQVNYTVTGGKGNHTYVGPAANDILYPGTEIEAFVEDEAGCRDFVKTSIDCQAPARCKNSTLDLVVNTECLTDSIGRQTGEVILHVNGKGGTGAYYLYGTQDGSKLKHSDTYQIIIIDSDSCYVIEEGRINCPPFDCTQSKLSIAADYTCVDTLLKAILNVSVTGNLGALNLIGNHTGEQLSQGEKYSIQAIDEAGCSVKIEGEIKCNFDSCAYARPALFVNYECIVDSIGNRSGQAVLHVSSSSYAGGIKYIGNKDGDTLYHLESYSVQMVDAFGCSLSKSGEIDCIPVSTASGEYVNGIVLIPNPANENVSIHFKQKISNILDFSMYDSNGNLLTKGKLDPSHSINFDIKDFPSGVIYIKLQNSNFFDILRFIKI